MVLYTRGVITLVKGVLMSIFSNFFGKTLLYLGFGPSNTLDVESILQKSNVQAQELANDPEFRENLSLTRYETVEGLLKELLTSLENHDTQFTAYLAVMLDDELIQWGKAESLNLSVNYSETSNNVVHTLNDEAWDELLDFVEFRYMATPVFSGAIKTEIKSYICYIRLSLYTVITALRLPHKDLNRLIENDRYKALTDKEGFFEDVVGVLEAHRAR